MRLNLANVIPTNPNPSLLNSTKGYLFHKNLSSGMVGGDVVAMQTFLEAKGYLTMAPGNPKGEFDEGTRQALAYYQASVGITPSDGYFGPVTRAQVMAAIGLPSTSPVSTSNSTVPRLNPVPTTLNGVNIANSNPGYMSPSLLDSIRGYKFNVDLTIGSRGTDVVAMQTFLEAKGYLTMAPGNPKGEFDEGTRLALSYYQASIGITPTNGVAGALTRSSINTILSFTPTQTNQPSTPPAQTISKADIVITDLTWDPASLTQSYATDIKMTYTLKNVGTESFSGRGNVCTLERANDIKPAEPYPTLSGPCFGNSPGVFTLAPGESKVFQGEHKDTSYEYRKKAGPFYLRLKFFPDDSTLESNTHNGYIDKTLMIIPAPALTPTIVSPAEGVSIAMDTENTYDWINNKGPYYAQVLFKMRVTGGIEKSVYSSTWVLKNLSTGEVINYNDVDNVIFVNRNEASLYIGFYKPGDWMVTTTVNDKYGGADAMTGTSAPLTFKIVPRTP
jgi:peptidoglycan hydrolase-like protein with peptidoglycan-binding domain